MRCLVLSQYTHLTDGQTDGQNCDSNTVRCITCSRTVKTRCCRWWFTLNFFHFPKCDWSSRQPSVQLHKHQICLGNGEIELLKLCQYFPAGRPALHVCASQAKLAKPCMNVYNICLQVNYLRQLAWWRCYRCANVTATIGMCSAHATCHQLRTWQVSTFEPWYIVNMSIHFMQNSMLAYHSYWFVFSNGN